MMRGINMHIELTEDELIVLHTALWTIERFNSLEEPSELLIKLNKMLINYTKD